MNHHFRISTSKNVLAITYSEGWKQHPDPDALIREVTAQTAKFEGQPWALFDDIRNWPIKSPSTIKACAHSVEELVAIGLKDFVVCANGLAISHWMMEKVIPETTNSVYFESMAEAKFWLAQHGYDNTALSEL